MAQLESLSQELGIEIEDLVYVIDVEPQEATDELKVKSVIERLSLIEETSQSIGLPTKLCFESINIEWDSLNDAVMKALDNHEASIQTNNRNNNIDDYLATRIVGIDTVINSLYSKI